MLATVMLVTLTIVLPLGRWARQQLESQLHRLAASRTLSALASVLCWSKSL